MLGRDMCCMYVRMWTGTVLSAMALAHSRAMPAENAPTRVVPLLPSAAATSITCARSGRELYLHTAQCGRQHLPLFVLRRHGNWPSRACVWLLDPLRGIFALSCVHRIFFALLAAAQHSSSPPSPHPARPARIDRPLRNFALRLHALDNLLSPRLDHHPAHDHLTQHSMQRLEIEDQIQFAHVFEQVIQAFDEDVDQIEESERRFCGGRDDDEVERCVVAVCYEGGRIVGFGDLRGGGSEKRRERQEVAAAAWAGGDEGEDLGDEALLDGGVLGGLLVGLRQFSRKLLAGEHTSWV